MDVCVCVDGCLDICVFVIVCMDVCVTMYDCFDECLCDYMYGCPCETLHGYMWTSERLSDTHIARQTDRQIKKINF